MKPSDTDSNTQGDNRSRKPYQSLPNKPKKRNNKITSEDKIKIQLYYEELNKFHTFNEEKTLAPKYRCDYDKEGYYYYIGEYDHQTFESYGLIKNKQLRLTSAEVFFLNQIGLISINNDLLNTANENIQMLLLYSYLRRSGKIVSMCELSTQDKDFRSYLYVYDTINDFKSKYATSLIYLYNNSQINIQDFKKILAESQIIFTKSPIDNTDTCKVSIAFTSGINMTFITINEEDISFPNSEIPISIKDNSI